MHCQVSCFFAAFNCIWCVLVSFRSLHGKTCCLFACSIEACGRCCYYTGCPRRNVPDFGRVFLMLKYTDITQNT